MRPDDFAALLRRSMAAKSDDREYLPALPYPVVGEWWAPAPLNVRTKLALAAFEAYAMRLLHERRRAKLDPNSKDIMARMIHARDPETGRPTAMTHVGCSSLQPRMGCRYGICAPASRRSKMCSRARWESASRADS